MVWEVKKIEELSKRKDAIVSGPFGSNLKVEHYKNKGIPIIRLQNIGKGYFINKDIKYISEEKAEELKYHSFISGDIVLAKLGIPIGKACKIPDDFKRGIIVADVVRIRLDKNIIDYDFLEYYLNTNLSVSQLTKNVSGATRPRVNLSDVRNIVIDLPPLPIQKRIVAILNQAFEKISKAKENAENNLKNAKEIFESYLQSVFENKGEGREEKKVESITKVINGYAFKSTDFSPRNSIKSVKITNVGIKEFIEETSNYLPETFKDSFKDFQVKEGDIVIALTRTIINGGLKVAVVTKNYDGALINQRVAALKPIEKLINQKFLYYFLCTNSVLDYVLKHVNTLMQPNLSINDLRSLEIPCPILDKQKTIVGKLDLFSKKTKKLESIYNQKLVDLEELKQSILQKAFKGELLKG